MASSCNNTDIWAWIQTLPPLSQWKKDSMSICICSSNSSVATLTVSLAKNPSPRSLSLSIVANFTLPVSLWISKPFHVAPSSSKLLDEDATHKLILNFIQDVLKYGPNKHIYPINLLQIVNSPHLKDIFNISLLTLVFLVCIYEAPIDLRSNCLFALTAQIASPQSKEASKMLMRLLGSNTEEQWLRCLCLAVTNWKMELKAAGNRILRGPSPLFSHAFSTSGLWKVQLYCPLITMEIENSSGSADDDLLFSLSYHQLEGVIQLNYKVTVNEKWVDVMVNVDNIRLDVIPLVSSKLLNERGAGASEKHFPSRISLQLTPTSQTDIISVSVSKSSENPKLEKEIERTIEGSLDAPHNLGLRVAAGETTTTVMTPWKFEEYAIGDSGSLNWYLYDTNDGKEVFASKPSPMSLFRPHAWFKHRYSNAHRPFTRQGGIVFAGDKYGDTVCWKVLKSALGKKMEWEVSGCIGLTYWPNKHRTLYNETRRAEFRETLQLTLG